MSAPQVDIFSLAAYGEIDSLRHLLAEDPRLLHSVDCYGLTPLHEAARNGNVHVVSYLLAEGADLTRADQASQTALHFSCGAGYADVAKLLLDAATLAPAGATLIDAADFRGRSALHLASSHQHDACVKLLLSRGANARLLDASGCPALSWTRDFKGVTASTIESPSPDAVVQAALARDRAQQREDCDDGDGDGDDDDASSTRLERLHAGLANEVVSDDDDDDE